MSSHFKQKNKKNGDAASGSAIAADLAAAGLALANLDFESRGRLPNMAFLKLHHQSDPNLGDSDDGRHSRSDQPAK
jgi:hypothetical protein